jgi:hypothetical protein
MKYEVALFVAVAALCGIGWAIGAAGLPMAEMLATLLLGWWRFAARVLPQQQVSASGVLTALVCLTMLLAGLHGFLSWFTQAWYAGHPQPVHWRFRWTAYAVGLTVLMFAAGIAFVGVVHQSLWLATSPEPRVAMAPDQAWYGDPPNTPKQIGLGLLNYDITFKHIPAGDDVAYSGGVLHSWQTLIMPYMVISNRDCDLTKPWNDSSNKNFTSRPVIEYLVRGVPGEVRDAAGYGISHYAGNEHVFLAARDQKLRAADLAGDTLIMGEAAGNFRPWADPANLRDPNQGINRSADGFGNASRSGAYFLETSGRVKFISQDVDPAVLEAVSQP